MLLPPTPPTPPTPLPPTPPPGAVVPLRHRYELGCQPGVTAAAWAAVSTACQRAPELPESLHSELHAHAHSARASSDVAGVRAVELGAAAEL